MMTGKKYSVYWYAIVNIIFGLNDGVEYNFKVEYWNDIQSKLDYGPWYGNDYFKTKLNDNDRINLCIAAKEFANLEGMVAPKLYTPVYERKQYDLVLLVECDTVPQAFLRYEESNNVVAIMVEKNKFLINDGREFHIGRVHFIPRSCPEIMENDPENFDMRKDEFAELIKSECNQHSKVKKSLLSLLSQADRVHLCAAAKTRTELSDFKFQSSNVKRPQIFEFVFPESSKENRVAIECPTSPRMYVFYANLRISEDIQVLIVGNP